MRTLSILLIILLPVIAFTQKNDINAYVVTNTGDTIKGFLETKEWKKTPDKVTLAGVTYEISNTKAFGFFDGATYRRYNLNYHLMPIYDSEVVENNENTTKDTIGFVRILIEGKTGLGEHVTTKRPYYFIIQNGELTELQFIKGIKNFTDSAYINDSRYGKSLLLEKSDYKQQLQELNKKADTRINDLIITSEYNEYDLMKIFARLNGQTKKVTPNNKNLLLFGIGNNYYTSTTQGEPNINSLYQVNLQKSTGAFISIAYKLISDRNKRRVNYLFNLLYTQYSAEGVRDNPPTEKSYSVYAKNSCGEIGGQIIYTINPQSQLQLSAGAGVNAIVQLSGKNTITRVSYSDFVSRTENSLPFRKFYIIPTTSINLAYKGVELFAHYYPKQDIVTYAFASWKVSRIGFGIRYGIKL